MNNTSNDHSKKLEIFCGTGGVGKTTIATSRALYLASRGKKILLITIDPAKRLKEILNLSNDNAGEVIKINSNLFRGIDPNTSFSFDAELMSPESTFKRIASDQNNSKILENRIFKILTRPNAGMNEILSVIEVQFQLSKNFYDTIVLDTPPGKHFLDFLESTKKIKTFFDKSFIEVFNSAQNISDSSKNFSIFKNVISTGINKLINYLKKVTGDSFVSEFLDAISIVYQNKHYFLNALEFHKQLQKREFSNWYLITSTEQLKIANASELQLSSEQLIHSDNYLIINKCLKQHLESWNPTEKNLLTLKNTLIAKEKSIKTFANSNYAKILCFPEVIDDSPIEHVCQLKEHWNDKGLYDEL